MKTIDQLKNLLRESQHALFNYESSVNMLKGLNCKQADEMIDADREMMIDKLMEMRTVLNNLVTPKPEMMSVVEIAENYFI